LILDRRGLALIHAQEPSDVVLVEPARRPGLRARIAKWFATTFGPEALDRPRGLAAF
jgi:hypothetical protein